MGALLIVDDDSEEQNELATYLRDRGHRVAALANPSELLAELEREQFDLVLAAGDLNGTPRLTLLRSVLQRHAAAVMALATAHPTVAEAVAVMRAGAYDYLRKPLSARRVELMLRRVVAVRSARRGHHQPSWVDPQLLLESANPQMARARTTGRQAAESDVPILLTGESGTGKRMLAAAIHGWSPRWAGPF